MEVEHGSLAPIVFSTHDGCWGPSATVAFRRRASLLSNKLVATAIQQALGSFRCKIAFSLLDSAIICLRGVRSSSTAQLTTPLVARISLWPCPMDSLQTNFIKYSYCTIIIIIVISIIILLCKNCMPCMYVLLLVLCIITLVYKESGEGTASHEAGTMATVQNTPAQLAHAERESLPKWW